MTTHTRVRAGGFTLVELLAVVAIIGILLTVAVPSLFRSEQQRSLRIEVQNVQHLMSFARSQAIATRTFVAVEFDLQVYPEPDRVRVLERATWNAGLGRWEGDEIAGMDIYVVAGHLDIVRVKVGTTAYLTGYHSIVFAPTGSAGMDDGSILGSLDVDVVRMDLSA